MLSFYCVIKPPRRDPQPIFWETSKSLRGRGQLKRGLVLNMLYRAFILLLVSGFVLSRSCSNRSSFECTQQRHQHTDVTVIGLRHVWARVSLSPFALNTWCMWKSNRCILPFFWKNQDELICIKSHQLVNFKI